MNQVIIRTANEQDLAALDRLYYDFHQVHAREVPDRLQDLGALADQDWSRLHQALRELLANEEAVLLVAEVAGDLVGLVEVYCRRDDEANPLIVAHRYAHVQSLMVSEAYRKQGIGRKLMEAARRWGRAKGAREMRLNVWEFNQGTMRFYEELGFRALTRMLVREL